VLQTTPPQIRNAPGGIPWRPGCQNGAPRLTLLTTSLDYGGAEKQVVCIATAMKELGLGVNVVCMIPPKAYESDLVSHEIPLDCLGMHRGVADPRAIFRLAGLLRKYRTDIIHSHMVGANLLARITSLIARAPVTISTAHNINEGPKWRELAYRFTDRLADLTTNVSMAGVARYTLIKAVSPRKILFVPNGVEPFDPVLDAESRSTFRAALGCESSWIWLAVGNLRKAKDYPTLLRAVSGMPETATKTKVLIVGSGEERVRLEELRRELSLEDKVQFLGQRTDVLKLLEIADGFVMSSAWEGLPLALIEASMASLPIVATDVGGNSEIIKNGVNGLLTPAGDSERLRNAMLEIQHLPEATRSLMGTAGREFALRTYSMQAISLRWLEIYTNLLKANSLAG
jgi:glycosyltransferase involved in cell wall biosynthesis